MHHLNIGGYKLFNRKWQSAANLGLVPARHVTIDVEYQSGWHKQHNVGRILDPVGVWIDQFRQPAQIRNPFSTHLTRGFTDEPGSRERVRGDLIQRIECCECLRIGQRAGLLVILSGRWLLYPDK